jgi:mannose-6-phosphate isomerase-like protein (cupin superfamily)
MAKESDYAINLDSMYGFLELIDVPKLIGECSDAWYNQTLCRVNDCVLRLGVMQGEFHWHKHDVQDEVFFVLQGEFIVDLENESVVLGPHQGYAVPKGVVHRTRAPKRCAILMMEGAGVQPVGD